MHQIMVRESIQAYIELEIFYEIDQRTIDNLVKSIVIQLLFYISYLDMCSENITKESFEECTDMIVSMIRPYQKNDK